MNLDKVVVGCLQSGFEHLQEQRLHILPTQAFQCLVIFREICTTTPHPYPRRPTPSQKFRLQLMTMASAKPPSLETEASLEITVYTTVHKWNFHLCFLCTVPFMLSVPGFNEFGQDLCAIVPTVILNKCSTAEITRNLWILHTDA